MTLVEFIDWSCTLPRAPDIRIRYAIGPGRSCKPRLILNGRELEFFVNNRQLPSDTIFWTRADCQEEWPRRERVRNRAKFHQSRVRTVIVAPGSIALNVRPPHYHINGNTVVPPGRNAGIYEVLNPSVLVPPRKSQNGFPRYLLLIDDQIKPIRPRIPS